MGRIVGRLAKYDPYVAYENTRRPLQMNAWIENDYPGGFNPGRVGDASTGMSTPEGIGVYPGRRGYDSSPGIPSAQVSDIAGEVIDQPKKGFFSRIPGGRLIGRVGKFGWDLLNSPLGWMGLPLLQGAFMGGGEDMSSMQVPSDSFSKRMLEEQLEIDRMMMLRQMAR